MDYEILALLREPVTIEPMIRKVTEIDVPEWKRMRSELWPDCPPQMHRLEMREQMEFPHAVFVYAREHGLGGFIELSVRERVDGSISRQVGYVEDWYVDPDLRGHGIGRQLIREAEAWTRELGLKELASDAELVNEESIRAHKALGFRETFRLVHFIKSL